MEETWASGAIDLLEHADSHIQKHTAFDSKIAFISVDNAVETSIRTFLSLPAKISGIKFSKREVDEAGNSFPKMLEILFSKAGQKLVGLSEGDIEHYHRIRNQLYHNGTGLGVSQPYLTAYRQIATVLLDNLFGVKAILRSNEPTLENLILLWNEIESLIHSKFEASGVDTKHTYKWEQAVKEGMLEQEDINQLTELRMIRNTQVHSKAENIDEKRIVLGVGIAKTLLRKLRR